MRDINIGSVPFLEAIEFFLDKVKIPTEHWDDMLGEIHSRAFTVAGATNIDVLNDIHAAVKAAIENGTTITDFRNEFDKTVEENGWSYNGSRGWRTRIIFDTNLRSAHMAGKWDQFQRTKSNRPYLQYLTVGDTRVRAEHAAWNSIILHIDDPWWNTHYPPNDWGCRCTIRSLSKTQLERKGLSIDDAPPLQPTPRINAGTGQDYGLVPKGIGVGWDYNVGKSWDFPDEYFTTRMDQLPDFLKPFFDDLQ